MSEPNPSALRGRGVTPELELESVSFSYGKRVALRDITLSLPIGVTGLLGPNGAGKSTLLSIAATTLAPQAGAVRVAGRDTADRDGRAAARQKIGFLPQRFDLMSWSSGARNVSYAAWAQGVDPELCEEKARRALELVDLHQLADRRVRTLSGGQRQRLGIACALAHDPDVLLLDEPTVGLDPVQRSELRSHLAVVGSEKVVLLSTHLVDDLARIADRIVVISTGTIVFNGTLDELHAADGDLEAAYVRIMGGSR